MRKPYVVLTAVIVVFLLLVNIMHISGNAFAEKNNQLELHRGQNLRFRYEKGKIFHQGEEVILSQEGEKYELPREVLNSWQENSFSTFVFPLAVIRTEETREVYHLEQREIIFTEEEALAALRDEWQRITGGEPPMIMELEIQPEDFGDHLSVKLEPDSNRIFFTLQHYMIATMDTAAGIYDICSGDFDFVNEIFHGGISSISWSDNNNNELDKAEYAALRFYDARGSEYLHIINTDTLEVIASFSQPNFK